MRAPTVLWVFLLALTLAAVGGAASPGVDTAAADSAWTYALYVNADNDLYDTWVQYGLPACTRIPASSDVRVVAMVDEPGATGTTLYEFGDGAATAVATYAEMNFGDGATFQWFLEEMETRYPSSCFGVTVYDHGYGWRYFSRDTDSHSDQITMPEAQAAIVGAGKQIDVLAFDCCNMADVAVIYQMAQTGLVGYVVASEEETEDDFPYDTQLRPLIDNPIRSPEQVACDLVDGYARYYLPRHAFNYVGLMAIDVAAVDDATATLDAWVARLLLDLPTYRTQYQACLNNCIYAFVSWQVDLRSFCDELVADPLIADTTLKTLSAQVSQMVDDATVDMWSGSWSEAFTGMTIWFGAGTDWSAYRTAHADIDFGKPAPTGVDWHAFLVAVNGGSWPSGIPSTLQDRDTYGVSDITFLSATDGWACGYNGYTGACYLFSTDDGGTSWTAQTNSKWDPYGFGAIENVGASSMWAVGGQEWATAAGETSLVLQTANAGGKWNKQTANTIEWLASVDFTDAQTGWICGTKGTLLKTANGGTTWSTATTWSGSGGDDLWAVDFTDAQNGWVAGGDPATMKAFLRRTADGGATWKRQMTVEPEKKARPGRPAVNDCLFFDVEAPLCAVGGDPLTGRGMAYYSDSGGASWAPATGIPSDTCLYAVTKAASGTRLFAVGTQGKVLRSDDGGATWTACAATPTTRDLTGAYFASDTTGWVVGDLDDVLYTNDGGASWSVTTIP